MFQQDGKCIMLSKVLKQEHSKACKNCCKSRFTICLNVQVYVVYTTEKVKMISFYYFNSIFLCTSLLKLREECQFDRFFLKRDM